MVGLCRDKLRMFLYMFVIRLPGFYGTQGLITMFNRPSFTYRIVIHTFNISLKVKKDKIKLNTQHVSVTYDHYQVL
jgi:hypothetical protein